VPLLLCDLDDTVLDRSAAFAAWVDRFLARRGLDAAEHRPWLLDIDEAGYRPRREFFALVRERLHLPDSVETLIAEFYGEFASLFRLEADTEAAVQRVRQRGWRVAIVTNGSPSQEDKILATGLDRLVDAWCISEVEGSRKPDVGLLQTAAERCREPLESAWLIGDNAECDIGAAHAAGIPSVWLRHRRTWPLPHFTPTHQADSFPEAVDLALSK
jgi:putative hydrolase of the HAD superfamily